MAETGGVWNGMLAERTRVLSVGFNRGHTLVLHLV